MRLLIAAACGFVGSILVRELRAARPDVDGIGIDNFAREGSRSNVEPLQTLGVRAVEGGHPQPGGPRSPAAH